MADGILHKDNINERDLMLKFVETFSYCTLREIKMNQTKVYPYNNICSHNGYWNV